jgi:hypothetical protein
MTRTTPKPWIRTATTTATLSGPSGGINLPPANYRLELDLRITARAPVRVDDAGERDPAAVDAAKATIRLRRS